MAAVDRPFATDRRSAARLRPWTPIRDVASSIVDIETWSPEVRQGIEIVDRQRATPMDHARGDR